MNILEILTNSRESIYPEDLDFFETELATGNYDENYIVACREQIRSVKNWLTEKDGVNNHNNNSTCEEPRKTGNKIFMDIKNLMPESSHNNHYKPLTAEQTIFADIKLLRESDNYKSGFKKYIIGKTEIDESFIDKNYSFFLPWEMDAVVSVKVLSESFLEKYFASLSTEKIARYQLFSESFFMKHYSDFNTSLVLTKGKNEWRKKEKRSKQLDVFLRLKGVKL